MSFEHFDDETHPEKMEAITNAADHLVAVAVDALIQGAGLHPASALSALVASSLVYLDGMSREGTQQLITSMVEENPEKQERALDLLVEGYAAVQEQITRDEAGGPIQ